MKVRPWMPDLPTELWVGNGYLLAEDGMLQLSPTGAASAIRCLEVPESAGPVTECDEKPSEAVVQRPTKKRAHGGKAKKLRQKPVGAKASGSAVSGVSYDKQSRKWRVRKWDPASKKKVFGGSFALKKEAEAKARELGSKMRRRPRLSGSTVTGVSYHKASQKWRVECWDPAIKKRVCGGYFAVMEEAEAKAVLAEKLEAATLSRLMAEERVEELKLELVEAELQRDEEAEERARLLVAAAGAAESVAAPTAPTAPAGEEAHGSGSKRGTLKTG
ncbi:unnamed protein product, partial [Symbiodinium microadriaticum]